MGLVSGNVTGGICPWPESTAWQHTERGIYWIQHSCYLTYILYFHILLKINEHNRCFLIQWGAYSCRCFSSIDAHSPALYVIHERRQLWEISSSSVETGETALTGCYTRRQPSRWFLAHWPSRLLQLKLSGEALSGHHGGRVGRCLCKTQDSGEIWPGRELKSSACWPAGLPCSTAAGERKYYRKAPANIHSHLHQGGYVTASIYLLVEKPHEEK